ncbi:MAG: hypothetical protein NT115_08955 [Proteobacteria bacterium]|nr:hypothetical protein [Pseudomonadota bacterium]
MKFLTGDATEIAHRLAGEYAAAFPSSLEGSQSRKAEDIRARTTRKLLEDVVSMQKDKRMGILKRIAFARGFQHSLAESGYSDKLIRELTADVLAKLTFAPRQ